MAQSLLQIMGMEPESSEPALDDNVVGATEAEDDAAKCAAEGAESAAPKRTPKTAAPKRAPKTAAPKRAPKTAAPKRTPKAAAPKRASTSTEPKVASKSAVDAATVQQLEENFALPHDFLGETAGHAGHLDFVARQRIQETRNQSTFAPRATNSSCCKAGDFNNLCSGTC